MTQQNHELLAELRENPKRLKQLNYDEKLSIKRIAALAETTPAVIYGLAVKHRISVVRIVSSDSPLLAELRESPEKLKQLYYGKKLNIKKIAELAGTKRHAISWLMKKYQIPTRPLTEAQANRAAKYVEQRQAKS